MKNIRFAISLKVFIFLGIFSLSVFAQNSEKPKNIGQNQKSRENSKSSSNLDLENTSWLLIEIKDYTIPELKRPVYLQFNQKDKLVTSSGLCNTVSGNYKRDNKKNSLMISLRPSTLLGCDPENEVEQTLGRSLKMVNRFEIADENLYLYQGKALLIKLIAGKEQ